MSPFRNFLEAHWGDLIALYFFHLGIGLILLSWKVHEPDLNKIGWSVFTAAMATLRFRGYLNGGGKPSDNTQGGKNDTKTGGDSGTTSGSLGG